MAIKSFRAINNNVTVVLDNGNLLFSNSLDKNNIDMLFSVASGLTSMTDDDIIKLIELNKANSATNEEKVAIEDKKIYSSLFDTVNSYPNILVHKDNSVYRKGIELTLPKFVLDKYIINLKTYGVNSTEFKSIDNFWMWLSLNTNKYAREELLHFLKEGEFMITPNGYFVAYRNVNIKEEKNIELTNFISSEFIRVKTKLKKATGNYCITNTGTDNDPVYKLEKITDQEPMGTLIGNLKELYQDLGNLASSTVYTDKHTGKMDIKLGKEVSIPRSECDESSDNDCSRGLHLGNKTFGFSFHGSTTLVCLCNPMNVVAVPKYNINKLRTCAYFPMAIAVKGTDGELIELDYSQFDDVYFNEQLNELELLAKSNKAEEVNHNSLPISKDIKSVIKNLQNVSSTVKGRLTSLN